MCCSYMAEGEGELPKFVEDKKKKFHRPAIVKAAMSKVGKKKNKGNDKTPPSQAWTSTEMDTLSQAREQTEAVPGKGGRKDSTGSKTSQATPKKGSTARSKDYEVICYYNYCSIPYNIAGYFAGTNFCF